MSLSCSGKNTPLAKLGEEEVVIKHEAIGVNFINFSGEVGVVLRAPDRIK